MATGGFWSFSRPRFENVDYWEINEAFAAQFLGVGRMLQEDYGIVLGHPIVCTALRLIVSLYYEN